MALIKITTKALDNNQITAAEIAKLDAPINAALADANGKASAFTITDAYQVRVLALVAEKLLEKRGVTKANRVGTTATFTPVGPSANSYKYGAASTLLRMSRATDGWRLVSAERVTVYPKQSARMSLEISESARDDAVRNAMAGFTVRAQEAVAA